MDFPEKLRALRKSRKLTQAQLAEQCKVSQQAIQQWEKGKTYPDLRTFSLLLAALRVSADFLMGNKSTQGDEEISSMPTTDKLMLKKFHALDRRGQETVLSILDVEYQRVTPKLEKKEIS